MRNKRQLIGILAIISLLVMTSCSTGELFEITQEGTFSGSQCKDHNPDYEVIMLESKFCSHCQETKPVFLAAAQEAGITPILLDVSEAEDRTLLQEKYKISIQYTPTFIFGCDYTVGAEENKEEYLTLFNQYKELGELQ